jgi:CBS domain-containing protein
MGNFSVLRPRFRRGVPRFLFSTSAATTPEYAILALAVIAIGAISVQLVGDRALRTFGQIDDSFARASDAHERQNERAADDGTSQRGRSRAGRGSFLWGQIVSLVTLALLVAYTWLLVRRKSSERKKQPRSLEAPPPKPDSPDVFDKRQQILRVLSKDVNALLEGRLEVRHLMTPNPITVEPGQTVEHAARMMEENNLDRLLVCDRSGALLGLLSNYYLRRTNAKKIRDAMAVEPLFVAPGALVNPTVTQMINRGISCVAVVEQGRVVGVLTTIDVQLALQCTLQLLFKATSEGEFEEGELVRQA